ncbi:FG-GAP-like repeat-containing protein [Granulosicoccus sp. 3-233]|uniref:FG-GAP-like repeat-containing protein n=1 Tax=Granulosicoccus sp. 3-233 TaxID=3417969 RepID=UPI003D34CA2C
MFVSPYALTSPIRMLVLSACLGLTACGGGGGGGTDGGDTGGDTGGSTDGSSGDDEVQTTLDRLNVDTNASPRTDASGEPLPDDYVPLGASKTLDKRSELFMAGPARTDQEDIVNLLTYVPDTSGGGNMAELTGASLETAWAEAEVHAAAGGDVDGDGFDEVVIAWHDPVTTAIRLKVIEDKSDDYITSSESTLLTGDPSWMSLTTGDFNGDGADQIAIAIAIDDDVSGSINLYFLEGSIQTSYVIADEGARTWNAATPGSRMGIELASGQLDRDAGQEMAVVINETFGSGRNQSPGDGTSFYYIYDDQNAGFIERIGERISGVVDNSAYLGVTGTVALGDVDGDGVDEILVAALDRFSVVCDDVTALQLLFDDLDAGGTELGAIIGEADISSCEVGGNNGHTEHLWAGILDIDGDQRGEMHVNGVIYEDLVDGSGAWSLLAEVPTEYTFNTSSNNGRLQVRRDNLMMSVGDVTSDGRDDLIIYRPGRIKVGTRTSGNITTDVNEPAVSIWSIAENDDEFTLKHIEQLDTLASERRGSSVVLLAVNVDDDSTVLQSVANSHQLVFSEPIVHAALAAPPCWDTGVQNTDECRTGWGTGNSAGVDASISHTISSNYHVGVEAGVSLPVVGDVGVELEQSVGVALTAEASLGYELTRTHTYTTGPMEDTVIATVMPYDQYTYRVLAHPVYPELVGEEIVVSLPRRPRTIQIERDFYNASLASGGVSIDDSVFAHDIGDPTSYPGRGDIQGFGVTSFGPFDVGLSGGSQAAEISESLVAGFRAAMTLSYETTVKTTAGKSMRGFSVGQETTASLGVNVGTSVVFSGTVGDISPNQGTSDNEYSFGILAYQARSSDQEKPFQVVNYWVE